MLGPLLLALLSTLPGGTDRRCGRRSVERRLLCRCSTRLGRRRSRRDLAYRRRRPALAAAKLRRRLPAARRLLSRRATRLGRRRTDASLHAYQHRRRSDYPRWRQDLDAQREAPAARRAADRLLQPAAGLGDRLPLGDVPQRRVCHRRRRAKLAAAAGRQSHGWTAADFVDPGHGIVAGRSGSLGWSAETRWNRFATSGVELRSVAQGEVAVAGRRFADRRRRPGAIRRPFGRRSAGGAELAEGRPAFRLRGIGGSRAEMLDRRLARHARVPFGRRRTHLERFRHRHVRAASRDGVSPTTSTAGRPANWARSWPRPTAGERGNRSGPAARRPLCWPSLPRPTTRRWNFSPASRAAKDTCRSSKRSAGATSRSLRATTSHRPIGCTRRWFASADARPVRRGSFLCGKPVCRSARGKSSRRGIASTAAAASRRCRPASFGRFALGGPRRS